jgi:hypothetical protein
VPGGFGGLLEGMASGRGCCWAGGRRDTRAARHGIEILLGCWRCGEAAGSVGQLEVIN